MIILQPCTNIERLQKVTLLAMLNSKPDTTRAIVSKTGEVIDISNLEQNIVNKNINNGTWVYYELLVPRRMLLINPDWSIVSFDPMSKKVCVNINAKSGTRHLNFTLNPLIF
jgi:hypothetical protein